jgi:hypothetical protein
MQRPCAQLGKDARLAAGQGRTLASVLPASAHGAAGRAETNSAGNLLHQPKAKPCQYKPVQVSTSEYNQ